MTHFSLSVSLLNGVRVVSNIDIQNITIAKTIDTEKHSVNDQKVVFRKILFIYEDNLTVRSGDILFFIHRICGYLIANVRFWISDLDVVLFWSFHNVLEVVQKREPRFLVFYN